MLDFIDGLSFTIDVAIDANKICKKITQPPPNALVS